MSEFSDHMLGEIPRRSKISRFRPAVVALIALAAILFQVYVPRFLEYLAYLELPLLVTVYFSLMKRGPVSGLFFGAAIGLVQDSLSHHPLGMFGIVKTLVGYFSANVSLRFDVDNVAIRFLLGFFFYLFHQFFFWVLVRALLDQPGDFDPRRELILGLLNAVVAIPLFQVLDRLKERG
ncbi:MAG: rod shape-determining protein MreD [Bryobacterales bacterium]|nr:rod shape-determining protein MreD [Bryobacterales bacterium]